jgi:hypothetical protein
MALSIPAATLQLYRDAFRHGKPIFSGDAANDEPWGWRGVNNQANYAYAQRTNILACPGMWDDSALMTTPRAAYAANTDQTYGQTRVYLGADVLTLRIVADVTDGGIQLRTSLGNGAGSGLLGGGFGVSGRGQRISTLVVAGMGGVWIDIVASFARDADAASAELRGFWVEEVEIALVLP